MPRLVNFLNPIRRQAPLNKGLLRWWMAEPFRTHSPRLQDLTRKSPMTLSGALRLGPRGRPGGFGSATFNGTSDYGQTAAIDLSAISTLTVSCWFYWDSFTNTDDFLLETSATSTTNAGAILIDPDNNTSTAFLVRVYTGVGNNQYSFPRPAAATWHHLVCTFNRNGGTQQIVAVYLNGVAQTLSAVGGQDPTATGGFGNHAWNFMCRNAASNFGDGRLDDIRIYNRVLPAWEARALMNASRRGYPQELRWSRGNDFIGESPDVPDPYIPYSVPYHRRSFKAMAPIKNAGHAMGTLSSAVPLTTIPGNALRARVVGVSGSATVYFREDSGTPSAANGTPIGAGGYADIVGRNNLEGFRAIEASPSGTLWVEYFDSVE